MMLFTQILLVLILIVLIIGFWDVVAIKLTKKDHELFDENKAEKYLNSPLPVVPTPMITMTQSRDIIESANALDPMKIARKQAEDRVGY